MPHLTNAEQQLLNTLDNPTIAVLGKARMREASMLIHRLMFLADEAEKQNAIITTKLDQATFERSAIAVAAFGFKSRENILQKEGLSDALRARCVQLRENYDYARIYREQNGMEPLIEYLDQPANDEAAR